MAKIEVYRVDSLEMKEMIFIAACENAKTDWELQRGLLLKGTHPVVKLQNYFNKYGDSDLSMEVVKRVDSENAARKVVLECKYPVKVLVKKVIESAIIDEPETEKAIIPEPLKFKKLRKKRK